MVFVAVILFSCLGGILYNFKGIKMCLGVVRVGGSIGLYFSVFLKKRRWNILSY